MREIVAKRYARALIQIGKEDGKYEQYGEELRTFKGLLEGSEELKEVMENPIYNREQKRDLFKAINAKLALSPIVTNFLLLLIEKRRLGYLSEIVRCYERLSDDISGRVRAKVVSAVKLEDEDIGAIRKRLGEITGKEVILSIEEDPSLIGGVVAQIGDMVYDGSLRTQIYKIKESLMKG